VPPEPGYLEALRALCDEFGALLIFDEVMTGFRVSRGGAAELFDIRPDLLCFGKVIGGGLPVGAYAGPHYLMDQIAPAGPVYQAGTLSGNPLAMAAGIAAVSQLNSESYEQLNEIGARLESGLVEAANAANVPAAVQRVGSMLSVFFAEGRTRNFAEAQRTDKNLFGRVFHSMLSRGFYLPPSALEAWFFTLAHSEDDIDRTVDAFSAALRESA
jgi:glutamate-1-semialdehyde 2,1-aminomutase